MNFLSTVLGSVILLATKVRDVSPQAVHACVKAEAQDCCLKCCGVNILLITHVKMLLTCCCVFPSSCFSS